MPNTREIDEYFYSGENRTFLYSGRVYSPEGDPVVANSATFEMENRQGVQVLAPTNAQIEIVSAFESRVNFQLNSSNIPTGTYSGIFRIDVGGEIFILRNRVQIDR